MLRTKDHIKNIEKIVNSGSSYIDAAIHYCETNNLEIEFIASVIRKNNEIKSKLETEAIILKALKNDTV